MPYYTTQIKNPPIRRVKPSNLDSKRVGGLASVSIPQVEVKPQK
jgi:hypothetical protein